MNSTHRLNDEPLEPFKTKRAQHAAFCQPASHLGLGLDASRLTAIVAGTGQKELFCRLPRPIQAALQARLICGERSQDG
jgi:hypothetical protein